MPKISLIATDLDGTLLYDRKHIHPLDKDALYAVHQRGTIVVFATGRELPVILPALDDLDLWGTVDYIIMAGGAQIFDVATRRTHTVAQLSPEIMLDVYHRYCEYAISILLPRDDVFYTNRVTHELHRESVLLDTPLDYRADLSEILTMPSPKLIFHGTRCEVENILPHMAHDCDGRIVLCRSHDNYIDCYAAGINKGAVLSLLCEHLHIPLTAVAAIGDNHNDIDLLKTAQYAACPGDGVQEAKAVSDYICCKAHEGAFSDFCSYLGFI